MNAAFRRLPGQSIAAVECFGCAVPGRSETQRLSGLTDFFAETQGRIGSHLPWPIQPWALRRNPHGILSNGRRRER